MNLFKKLGITLLLISLILSISAPAAFASDTIKIGSLVALTGDWAAYGQTERSGQLAVDEINAAGGVLASR